MDLFEDEDLKRYQKEMTGVFISFRFKWSNFMDEDEKTVTNNVDEDMASMMLAAGIWHLEHAHLVSSNSILNKIILLFKIPFLVVSF